MSSTSTPSEKLPKLENGDRVTRDEFERRYQQMPNVKKAELIEGIVYRKAPSNQASLDVGAKARG